MKYLDELGLQHLITKFKVSQEELQAETIVKSHTAPSGIVENRIWLDLSDSAPLVPDGLIGSYREKLTVTTGAIDLTLGNVFLCNTSSNTTFSITNAIEGEAHSFTLMVNTGATAYELFFPNTVRWRGGTTPSIDKVNTMYIFTFTSVDGGVNWFGMLGGDF